MSTPSINPAAHTSAGRAHAHNAQDHRPPLSRLTTVELRKMLDTRSGVWVMLGIVAVTVIFALVNGLAHGGRDATYTRVLHDAAQPFAYLLPLLGVLLICGEWTQRTTLTTFALVPDRRRVIKAKAIAGLVASTAALIVTLTISVALTATFSHAPGGAGTLPASVIVQSWLLLAGWMLVGLAFGMALLTTVPAIIAYLLLPIACAGIASAVPSLSRTTAWLDVARSLAPLTLHPLSATQWAHLVTALALWIGLPLIVGLWRISRADLA